MKNRQAGITLIELMISLVLSLVLLAGISSLFLQVQKINRSQRAINSMTDDARYALEMLQKEIRRTGGLRSKLDSNGVASKIFSADDAIEFAGITPFNISEYVRGDISGSPANDAFVIRYQLLDANDLNPDDPSNNNSPCTANSLLATGEDPAEESHVIRIYYYVSNGSLFCTSKRTVAGLCNADFGTNCELDGDPIALIDNVQKLSVRYGVDTDADHAANFYVNAASVEAAAHWQNIVSMRLSLALKSEDTHLAQQVLPYTVEGAEITPSDNSLYRVFSTTIAFRNQL